MAKTSGGGGRFSRQSGRFVATYGKGRNSVTVTFGRAASRLIFDRLVRQAGGASGLSGMSNSQIGTLIFRARREGGEF